MKSKILKAFLSGLLSLAVIIGVSAILYVPEKTAEFKDNILILHRENEQEKEFIVNMKNYKSATAYPVLNAVGELDWYITVKTNLFSRIFPDSNTLNNIIRVDSGGWESLQNGGAAMYSFVYEGVPTVRNVYYTEADIEKDGVDRDELSEKSVLVWSAE